MTAETAIPRSIAEFLDTLPNAFDPDAADGLDAVYHFTFTGPEAREATVIVRERRLEVREGHAGTPSLAITADSGDWLRFLAGEETAMGAVQRLTGPLRLYVALGRSFPSVVSEDDLL